MHRFLKPAVVAGSVLLFGAVTAVAQTPNSPTSGTQVGTLACDLSGGIGLIVTSSQTMTCKFQPAGGRVETYTGSVRRFGLDIGVVTSARMVWAVVAPVSRMAAGSLAGNYIGVSAEGTVGVGAGANLLVGGSNNAISLQPISLQAQGGVNIAAGVSELVLTFSN